MLCKLWRNILQYYYTMVEDAGRLLMIRHPALISENSRAQASVEQSRAT